LEKILIRAADKMGQLVQQELAKAASDEADFPPQACPYCGEQRLYSMRKKKRTLVTTKGEIHVERTVWLCAACRHSHAPFDRAMGVARGAKWTPEVERNAARLAAAVPFEEASEILREMTGLEVSSSEIDRIAQQHGSALDREQRRAEEVWRQPVDPLRETPEPDISCEHLVIEADATSVLTVSGEEHKSVYCATVFGLEARGKSNGRPFIAHRLYTASADNMEDFSERLKALVWRAGLRRAVSVSFVGDGAACLWKWAQENLPPDAVFIQDFWHVCEHLAELAKTLYPQGWEQTFSKWRKWLRKSKITRLIETLRELHARRRGKARQALAMEIGYLEKGQHRMDYARYEKEGWVIGSGAVEGTCKHLIKKRFCVTGARWRRGNIHKVLALRLSLFNKEWEDYWTNRLPLPFREECPLAA